jgi:ABC-type phosphate transport system substrate-binding protein
MVMPPGENPGSAAGNRIVLPRFAMRRRAGFKLLVLLTGDGDGVLAKGRMRGGRLVHETRGRSPSARNLAFGTVLTLLIGTQAGVALGEGPPIPSSCRGGQLVIQGSTAFAPVGQQIGEAYVSTCRDAAISVTGTASFNGLDSISVSGAGGAAAHGSSSSGAVASTASGWAPAAAPSSAGVQIAMSDGPAPNGYRGVVGHPVAVIIFGVVVNKKTGVFNLTTTKVRQNFSGGITNWKQHGGPDLPISCLN